jgi:alkaline phosphatase isozyme conversion protein
MTGTPAEMLSADYIRQQFADMGYQSDIRSFHSRYIYTSRNKTKNWHNVTGSTVIAAHEGPRRPADYYYGASRYLRADERCRYR